LHSTTRPSAPKRTYQAIVRGPLLAQNSLNEMLWAIPFHIPDGRFPIDGKSIILSNVMGAQNPETPARRGACFARLDTMTYGSRE
jgi:hypothetical protein